MEPGRLIGPERRGPFEDLGNAAVFLFSLVLLVAVGWGIFTGVTVTLPLGEVAQLVQPVFAAPRATPMPASTTTVDSANDVGTSRLKPRPLGVAALATATPAPTATPEAQPTPTSAAQGSRVKVGNTESRGVYLRRTPNLNDRLVAWPDNTTFELVGEDVQANGIQWKHVKDPRGNEGYVPAQYVVPVP